MSEQNERARIGKAAGFIVEKFGNPPITDHRIGWIVEVPEFAQLLQADFAAWEYREGQNTPFGYLKHQFQLCTPAFEVRAWEKVLSILNTQDPSRYQSIHKGEPFYWLAQASYQLRNYEGALFWMDCALAEDARRQASDWKRWPAASFLMIEDTKPDQAAYAEVQRLRRSFDEVAAQIKKRFGMSWCVEEHRGRLVLRAMETEPSLRSVVTAFATFLLEFSDRRTELGLAPTAGPTTGGSTEPFILHLFKGCVLFESVLKHRFAREVREGATLNDLLTAPTVFPALGFARAPQGLGISADLDELHEKIESDTTSTPSQLAIRATWGLRNMIGHNMALPARPSVQQYDALFHYLYAAIVRAIQTLPAQAATVVISTPSSPVGASSQPGLATTSLPGRNS